MGGARHRTAGSLMTAFGTEATCKRQSRCALVVDERTRSGRAPTAESDPTRSSGRVDRLWSDYEASCCLACDMPQGDRREQAATREITVAVWTRQSARRAAAGEKVGKR